MMGLSVYFLSIIIAKCETGIIDMIFPFGFVKLVVPRFNLY